MKTDSTFMKTQLVNSVIVLGVIAGLPAQLANAVEVNFRTVPMTIGATDLSFVADGVDTTVSGYQAEIDGSSGQATIYGPFSTDTAIATPSFLFPGFGRVTQLGGIGEPDFFVQGLGMQTSNEDLGQTEFDQFSGGFEPGLDNALSGGNPLPSIQFAVFAFSSPVDVSQVIVDDVSNFGRSIWVAGGNSAPDLAQDFVTAFTGFSFINSADDASDGPFTHSFAPLMGIQYLAIGSPPDGSLTGDLGQVTAADNEIAFYIEGLNVTSVIPLPAAAWLFGSGLLGLIAMARRR